MAANNNFISIFLLSFEQPCNRLSYNLRLIRDIRQLCNYVLYPPLKRLKLKLLLQSAFLRTRLIPLLSLFKCVCAIDVRLLRQLFYFLNRLFLVVFQLHDSPASFRLTVVLGFLF